MTKGRAWLLAGVGGAALVAGACVSIEKLAPPVDDRIGLIAEQRGQGRDAAVRGRAVFIAECRTCHSLNPPGEFTRADWEDILPTMSRKAELSRDRAADLRAYIFAAQEAAGPP